MNKRDGLALIRAYGKSLGPRAMEILGKMVDREDQNDDDGELVEEGREVWLGMERTSKKIMRDLLRACAIKAESNPRDRLQRYVVNETGREIVARARRQSRR